MAHKCFVSFKSEDLTYKEYIRDNLNIDMIDKSLNEPINSYDEEYIMRKIREDYLSDSTVTIFLIGYRSSENLGWEQQRYIKRELQSSLYNSSINSMNGILGVVLPSMYTRIYGGSYTCQSCGNNHDLIYINDETVIKEFSYNYFIPNNKCHWAEDDRYCVLVRWSDFENNAEYYIDNAFDKRYSEISAKIRLKPE